MSYGVQNVTKRLYGLAKGADLWLDVNQFSGTPDNSAPPNNSFDGEFMQAFNVPDGGWKSFEGWFNITNANAVNQLANGWVRCAVY